MGRERIAEIAERLLILLRGKAELLLPRWHWSPLVKLCQRVQGIAGCKVQQQVNNPLLTSKVRIPVVPMNHNIQEPRTVAASRFDKSK